MRNRRLKVGVVGVGSLGQWHARIYSELDQTELCGVFDADPEQARTIAERYETRVFDSIEELASQVEAASLAVPTHLHHAVAIPLIRRGIHLLIEKPLAATLEEARALVAESERAGIILQVGHVERFNPVMAYLESNLDRPRFIEALRLAPYPPPRPGLHPRGTEVSVVLDLMIHDLEIILHLVRSPVCDVHAVGVPVLSPHEDIANARLRFENGCVANVTASRISREKVRKIRVFQADAYLSLDYQEQAGQLVRKTAGGIESMAVPIEKGEPLLRELSAFSDCVRQGGQPAVSGRQAFESLKLAAAIRACIEKGGS